MQMEFWRLLFLVALAVLLVMSRFGGFLISAALAFGALSLMALLGYATSLSGGGEMPDIATWQKLMVWALGGPVFAFMLIRCYRGFKTVAPTEAFGTRLRLWFEGRT